MDKIIIKNNFAVSVKKIKNDNNGNPRYEINIFTKLGNAKEFENINYLCYTKKINIGRYSKVKNIFTVISYNIEDHIDILFISVENIFNE